MELEHGTSLSPLNSCARSVVCTTATDSVMTQPSWYPQHQYYCDTDTLIVYLVTPVPGLINNTEDAVPGLLVDYTATNQIVDFDVEMASVRTKAHFWQLATVVQGAPLCLQINYSQEADTLTASFVDNPQHCRLVCTDDDRITIWVDHAEKWESIVISHAMRSIAKSAPIMQNKL